ncbi:MAG TPA: SLC13 family permease [Gemmatimonadaceae bacterium]|nr:SLC13 family permease [Gemmatimonadaceae bacterium]
MNASNTIAPKAPQSYMTAGRAAALIAGPLGFLVVWSVQPGGLNRISSAVLGVALWMAIWWISECLPLAVTALLPISLFPLIGVATTKEAASHFANEVVFLYLGGFLLAVALERWNAHQRVALAVIGAVGTSSRQLVLGVMLATAFISMWISNTATAAMMYPIALAIGSLFGEGEAARSQRVALLLGVAFAASIGGMATLIGTPPNLIMAGAARELIGVNIDFFTFLKFGLPVALVLLPTCWALLVFVFHRERLHLDAASLQTLRDQKTALGRLRGGELSVLLVFGSVAIGWFFREPKAIGALNIPGLTQLFPGVTDAGIAVTGAIMLFLLPGRNGAATRPLLTWKEAREIPWDVLLLFGGGLSLAAAMESSGLAASVGVWMSGLQGLPLPIVLLGVAAATVVVSELASNSATASMGMPIAVSLAAALDQPPLLMMLVIGLAASVGFALPMATPPNAIVFGSGELSVRQMARAGLALDIAGVVVVVGVLLAVF